MAKQTKFSVGEYEYTLLEMNLLELPDDSELVGPAPDDALVKSIDACGLIYPVVVTNFHEKLHVIDGRRRIKACRALGLESITAMYFEDVDPIDQAIWTIVTNERRSNNPVSEYLYYKELRERADWEEIARIHGMNKQHFDKVMSLDSVDETFLDAYTDGKIAESTLFDIAKLGKPRQQYLQEVLDSKGKVAASDVKAAKQARAEAILRKKPELPNMPEAVAEDERPFFIVLNEDALASLPRDIHGALDRRGGTSAKVYRLVEV